MEFLSYKLAETTVLIKKSERRILAWLWNDFRPSEGFLMILRIWLAMREGKVRKTPDKKGLVIKDHEFPN
ncbi:MAG: hypothetical protein GTO24_15920 [candidate division Zixibacteria bacterium]|nr:hypothetical protein [candidate division Zixibacteria bacterium]